MFNVIHLRYIQSRYHDRLYKKRSSTRLDITLLKKVVFRESRGFISTFYYFQEAAYFASILIGNKKAQY